jgi:hypothetical protein
MAAMSRAQRDMLRSGRISDPGIGWTWSPFAFAARRHQTAHQLDFQQLKRLSAAELLEILVSTHPDISDAVWMFLRLAETPWSIAVSKVSGALDSVGQRHLEEMLKGIGAPQMGAGFTHSPALSTRIMQTVMMMLVRAAVCIEVEPTPNLRGVRDIHIVDPARIEFRADENGRLVPWMRADSIPRNIPESQRSLWQGNYKRLDSPTIIWEALDSFPDDPYGREPLLPVLQVVFFEIQVLADLQAVVHNQGYPRLEVKVLQEVLMKRAAEAFPQLKADPKAFQDFVDKQLQAIADYYSALEPDDTITHFDTTELKAVGVEGKGPTIDVSKLISIIEARIATGCKTFLTMLSRHTGTAEGARSTDTLIYQKSVAAIQKAAARAWGRALTVALNLMGRQGTVEWTFDAPDLRTPDQQEKDFGARIANAKLLLDQGAVDEARKYLQTPYTRARSNG